MQDWIGLGFLVLLVLGAFFGLRALSKPRVTTSDEFERNAAEGTTAIGATMNALQEIMNPAEAKAKETVTQLKEGRYNKKQSEGKANGEEATGDTIDD